MTQDESERAKLRVGIVCPYSFEVPGGVQFHIRDFSQELRRKGHEVLVLAPGKDFEDGIEAPDFVEGVGKAFSVPANGSVARISFSRKSSKAAEEWIEQNKFDILHLHQPDVPSLSLQVLFDHSGPMVGTYHAASDQVAMMKIAGYLLNRRLMKKLDACIAVSEEAKKFMMAYADPETPINIIPNGVFTQVFREAQPDSRFVGTPESPTIAFLGRIGEERKGFSVLVKAIPMILEQIPHARFFIGGPGVEAGKAQIEEHAGEYADHIEFLGPLSDEAKQALFSSVDLYIAPQTGGESFGIVLVEAMSAGACVLASDLTAFQAVLDYGHAGALFRNADTTDLARQAVSLLRDPHKREEFSSYASQWVNQYDWSRITDDVIDIYYKILNK